MRRKISLPEEENSVYSARKFCLPYREKTVYLTRKILLDIQTVEGLTTWVMGTYQIRGDNLASIHANTEQLIREDWADIVPSSFASDITYTPYRMYLFISDEKTGYNYNVLYDTYEVKVTRTDGSVFTSYEACRYTDLKIPADGVLTADYGMLQGFNFGFAHGFAYDQAFSGWTSPEGMEGDLRYVNDGRHLAD